MNNLPLNVEIVVKDLNASVSRYRSSDLAILYACVNCTHDNHMLVYTPFISPINDIDLIHKCKEKLIKSTQLINHDTYGQLLKIDNRYHIKLDKAYDTIEDAVECIFKINEQVKYE